MILKFVVIILLFQNFNSIYPQNLTETNNFQKDKFELLNRYAINNTSSIIFNYDSSTVLDSVITQDEWGYVTIYKYKYNSIGNIIQLYVYDTLGYVSNMTYYEYNSNNKVNSEVNEKKKNDIWENYSKEIYQYNQFDSLVNDTKYFWSSGEWKENWRIIHEFENNGNKIAEYYQNWQNGNWIINGFPHYYSYDKENRLISETFKFYTTFGDVVEVNNIYTYDNHSKLLTKLSKDSNNSGPWEDNRLQEYYYNNEGQLNSMVVKDWRNYWKNNGKVTYKYNSFGKLISEIWQIWDSSWVNSERILINYDDRENKISEFNDYWKGTSWNYSSGSGRTLYNYDSNNNCTLELAAAWIDDQWTARKENLVFQDSFGRTFNFYTFKFNAYYKPFNTTAVTDYKISNVTQFVLKQNYPNPFNPKTTIKYSILKSSFVTLKVYDMLGKEVTTLVNEERGTGNYKVDFDGSYLPSGVYFYRMQAGIFSETKKLVLLK